MEAKNKSQELQDDEKQLGFDLKEWALDWWPLLIALLLFLIAFLVYGINFFWPVYPECLGRWDERQCLIQRLSDDKSGWGQLGDYMGGLVNPVIGLLTIVLLVRSLRQNEKALSLSKEELAATRAAVEQAVNAQEKMEKSLRAQLTEAKSQNNFANYYKHLEEFSKYCSSIEVREEKNKITINARKLHKFLFMHMRDGDPKIPQNVCSRIFSVANNAKVLIDEVEIYIREKTGGALDLSSNVSEQHFMQRLVAINVKLGGYVKVKIKTEFSSFFDPVMLELMHEINLQLTTLKIIMDFDPEVDPLTFDPIDEIPHSLFRLLHHK